MDNSQDHIREANKEKYKEFSQEVNGKRSKSQFIQKVDTYPVVHNIWLNLLARYSLIKDTHPIVKEGLEFGEKTASWAEEKAEYLITVTKLDKPLKRIDNAALNGVVQFENTQNQVRNRFNNANKAVQTKIETTTKTVNKGTEWVRSSVFIPAHNVMDFLENKLESVMLKPSSATSNEPGLFNTAKRLIDVTYRINVGVISSAGLKLKDITDKKNWENFYNARIQPHTPSKVRVRQSIIYQEISKEWRRETNANESNESSCVQQNKELLEVDRKIINLGRAAILKVKGVKQQLEEIPQKAKEQLEQLPSKAWSFGATSFSYTKDALSHMTEARSLKDLGGITLYEVRGVLMAAQDNIAILRRSTLLDGAISWMAAQEKMLSTST